MELSIDDIICFELAVGGKSARHYRRHSVTGLFNRIISTSNHLLLELAF